jgi:hypothetical protein
VIGAIGAVPTPSIADALDIVAETLTTDPTEESQHSALLLYQASRRIRQLQRELAEAQRCATAPSEAEWAAQRMGGDSQYSMGYNSGIAKARWLIADRTAAPSAPAASSADRGD